VTLRQVFAKLPAADVGRARAFYARVLDLEPVAELNRHLHYEVGGSRFLVFPSQGRASGTHDQLGFVVDDVRAEVARLRRAGVEPERFDVPTVSDDDAIADFGEVTAAWFRDSEGNLISMTQFATGD
jgi:predicted enzyme related to lactoylglutathione lyase